MYSYQREVHAKSSPPVWHHSRLHHPGIFKEAPTLPLKHGLQARRRPTVQDFEGEILIAYPVAEKRIDLIREVLCPAKIGFERRTAELTVAILQLVASRRGLAAPPNWRHQELHQLRLYDCETDRLQGLVERPACLGAEHA
jgi:hypothetical protein